MLVEKKNIEIRTPDNRSIFADFFYDEAATKQPLVIYCHGFKGFKDWANFDLIARIFAINGFAFLKFNFSYNGMSKGELQDFDDLTSFGLNNASRELYELQYIVDWIQKYPSTFQPDLLDENKVFLIGHSRGGGAAIIIGQENNLVKKVVTWASIADYNHIWKDYSEHDMDAWKKTGISYTINGRTGQQMPLYYQLYEDYLLNTQRLNIQDAVSNLTIPLLVCHGTSDDAVIFTEAEKLVGSGTNTELYSVAGANHVFGRKHPWPSEKLPSDTENIVTKTIAFLNN